uniref:BPI fold-containing family B member 3-like n=1 Tax=Pogona vitticeps TaxID=103695 RepID=A0ABM5G4M2_9SAUR
MSALKVFTGAILKNGSLLNHLKGIVLSNVNTGGLFGPLKAKQKHGITELKIVNLKFVHHRLVLMPAITGAELSLAVQLDIIGCTLPDLSNLVSISLQVTFRVQYGLADFQNNSFGIAFHKCGAEAGAIKITLLGSTISPSLLVATRKVLIDDINRQICAVLKTPYDLAVAHLVGTLNVPLSLGPYATLRCSLARMPLVCDTFAVLDLFIDVEVPGKGNLSIPDSAGSINLPPRDKFKHCQSFHPELFNILLSVLAPNEPQELSCTLDKFSGADELRSAILALVLSKNQGIVSVGALHIRISIEANPTVVFGPNDIVITATLKVEFFIRNADGSIYFVLVVRSRVTLGAVLSFVNGRLIFVASVTGNALELISSDAGVSDDVSSLEPHCANLLGETFLLVFNGRLAVGIPVPSVYGIVMINPTFQFFEGALVACV